MLGALDSYEGPNRWQVSVSWRYQKSDRHFRGTHEEENRFAEGSEVINHINLAEIGIRYNVSPRTSLSVGVPYLMAERSSPIRDADRVVVDRSVTHATGLSDITVTGRRLLWDPALGRRGNLSVGLGVKLPTGKSSETDVRTSLVDGELVREVQTVDQSIQPGDGGLGFIVDLSGYYQIGPARTTALYAAGTYLINPEGTSGVPTFRGRENEALMSIADQYLIRLGATTAPASWDGWGVSLGGRMEAVPAHDLIGTSRYFRRPGYAISVEPGVSWSRGPHTVSLAVPIAVQRNRVRSVPDLEVGGHGDAAFADWVMLLGYWRRF
ncbi:MAG TPA: hypothetical protein VHM02_08250 [Thermoanaerobaculia bacterium]|nr:hypothetical protein [Thermoanaerobaculia bacterium]